MGSKTSFTPTFPVFQMLETSVEKTKTAKAVKFPK